MTRERDLAQLSPVELNLEFRRLFQAIPAVEISMLGTIMDSGGESVSLEMTDLERESFQYLFPDTDKRELDEDTLEMFVEMAKGHAVTRRRADSMYGAAIMTKLEPLIPFVKGTGSFNEYIRREVSRCIRDGIGNEGKDHWLYGGELGGIFNSESVEQIEEVSIQIFHGDVKWYGRSPMPPFPQMFEADYDNDPNYRSIVDLGRKWKKEFVEKYKRVPTDVRAGEIVFP